jgi:hypothetical protein
LNILITNIQLTVPGGTVSYVQDLAHGLRDRGFSVEIYTLIIGTVGNDLIKAGFNVTTQLTKLLNKPDIIHAHHNPVAHDVLRYFKTTPVIFFLHDKTSPFDRPIKHPNIIKHVAVDYFCLERLLQQGGIPPQNTAVVYNWVNTHRFKARDSFAEQPQKALVFSNYATAQNHYRIIEQACRMAGLELEAIGEGMGNLVKNPESILGQYDLVFAKAKAAMEALATGAAVILCDYAGMGEMVTADNMPHYRKYNFGRKTLTRPITVENILAEIKKFSSAQNRANATAIANEASFEKTLDQLIGCYQEQISLYAAGQRGPAGHWQQTLHPYILKGYFYFTRTKLFQLLSAFKYKIKNRSFKSCLKTVL